MVKTKVWLGVWSLSAMCPLGFICAYQGSTEPAKPPELQSAIEPNLSRLCAAQHLTLVLRTRNKTAR